MAYSHGRVMPSEKWMLAFTCSNSALDSLTGRTKQQFWRTLRLTRIEQKPALPLKQQCLSLNRRWKALPSSWHTPVQHPMILLLVQFPWKCTNPPPAPPQHISCYIRLRSKPSFWYPTKHQRRSSVAPTPARSWRKRQGKRSSRSSISRGLTLVTSWLR